jgi:hypothetical protein
LTSTCGEGEDESSFLAFFVWCAEEVMDGESCEGEEGEEGGEAGEADLFLPMRVSTAVAAAGATAATGACCGCGGSSFCSTGTGAVSSGCSCCSGCFCGCSRCGCIRRGGGSPGRDGHPVTITGGSVMSTDVRGASHRSAARAQISTMGERLCRCRSCARKTPNGGGVVEAECGGRKEVEALV